MLNSSSIPTIKRGLLSVAFLLSVTPNAVLAEDITIQDTAGFTRATSQVDSSSKVEFTLVNSDGNSPEGVPVTLTNAATGEVLHATSSGGMVVFEGVTPGVWTVSTTSTGITFTNVIVASAIATGGTFAAGALVPALVIAGGGAGIAIAVDNNRGSSGGDEISPAS